MNNLKNEARTLFQTDCRDKKTTARSASKKVTHSGCRLPTRTHEQIKAMNGPVISYNFNLPMGWKQFTALDVTIQRRYLEHLAQEFHVDEKNLPDLLGARYQAVSHYLVNRGLFGCMRSKLRGMPEGETEPRMDAWRAFCDSQWSKPNAMEETQPVVTSTDMYEKASQAFKEYRAAHKLSQKELGQLLGCSGATVSRLECKLTTSNVCAQMLSRLKKLDAPAPVFTAGKAPSVEAEVIPVPIAETLEDGTCGLEVHKVPAAQPEKEKATGATLTLSGSVSSILSAIERLFSDGDSNISVHIEY